MNQRYLHLRPHPPTQPPAGFTLIEVLLGATIMILAASAGASGFGYIAKYVRLDRMLSDKIAARNAIINALDCTATLTPMPNCAVNSPITLRDVNGASLIDNNGNIGTWKISAACQAASGIVVSGIWTGGTADPLTGAGLAMAPLFPTGAAFCRNFIIGKRPLLQPTPTTMTNVRRLCYFLKNNRRATSWEGFATCPAGYMAISGGANCGPNSPIQASLPTGPSNSRWFARCCSSNNVPTQVYAVCAAVD
jgi:type II secretory pathway pseudopilin PulG